MSAPSDPHLNHWADHAATRTLGALAGAKATDGSPYEGPVTVAAGITPSGVVHIGNFREVMTVDLVARALRDRGADVRFIYSWDDFDVFRKVPKDLPGRERFEAELGRSIADVPDPWGEHQSYAAHHIDAFESSLAPMGIAPEFIRQSVQYRKGTYAEGIRKALQGAATIRNIINGAREKHGARNLLADDWLPLSGFCDGCGKDQLAFSYDGDWTVGYTCQGCAHEAQVDLRNGGNLKLPWRVDWPMRWAYEHVGFEPGGKDHSSAGGSYDTAKDIVREIYGWVAPQYVGYDFVSLKGAGGKVSSSAGGVVTVADCLEVYEPELLRWLFASYRPNTEFAISFDLDVIKIYEDYDRAVRLAHEADDGGRKDKKRQNARRTVHLASPAGEKPEPGTPAPARPGFRHLSVILQIFDGDIDRAREHYRGDPELAPLVATDADAARFDLRARCVWTWIDKYAPEDFRYRIRNEAVARPLAPDAATAVSRLVTVLESHPAIGDKELGSHMKSLVEGTDLELKALYPVLYDLLIGRDHGPKLSSLLATMGTDRALPLLRPSAQAST